MIRNGKPNLLPLYLTAACTLALLLVEMQMPFAAVIHQLAEDGIIVLGFGLLFLWIAVKERRLTSSERENERRTLKQVRVAQGVPSHTRYFQWGITSSGERYFRVEADPTKGRFN